MTRQAGLRAADDLGAREGFTRTRVAVVLIAMAVACSKASPPLTGTAPESAGASPTPTVAWTGRDLSTTGLPAIASDGGEVVIAHRDTDGGRGNPNLTLIEKDRQDREVHRLVVLTANEFEAQTAGSGSAGRALIDERAAAATAWLRERHGTLRLRPMAALSVPKRTVEGPVAAVGAGVTIRWASNELAIAREGAPPVVRSTPDSWLAKDYPMCRTCTEVCHNEALLGGGAVDVERTLALVIIAYMGSDTCWEPSSQEHVVAW
jgi:hypothetical protein